MPEQVEDDLILDVAEPSGQHPKLPPPPPSATNPSIELLEHTEQQPVLPPRRSWAPWRLLLLGGGLTASLVAGAWGSGLLDRWAGVPYQGLPLAGTVPDAGPTLVEASAPAPVEPAIAAVQVDGANERDASPGAPPDAGAPDAGASDNGAPDAGAPDAGAPDAGVPGTVRLVLARREPPPDAGDDVIYVQLLSSPSGATVQVNGKSYGETPGGMRFRALLTYDVEVAKAGYAPVKARVYLPRRNGQALEATLAPK